MTKTMTEEKYKLFYSVFKGAFRNGISDFFTLGEDLTNAQNGFINGKWNEMEKNGDIYEPDFSPYKSGKAYAILYKSYFEVEEI